MIKNGSVEEILNRIGSLAETSCAFQHHRNGDPLEELCSNEFREKNLLCGHASHFESALLFCREKGIISVRQYVEFDLVFGKNYMYGADLTAAIVYGVVRSPNAFSVRPEELQKIGIGIDVPLSSLTLADVNPKIKSMQTRAATYRLTFRIWLTELLQRFQKDPTTSASDAETTAILGLVKAQIAAASRHAEL